MYLSIYLSINMSAYFKVILGTSNTCSFLLPKFLWLDYISYMNVARETFLKNKNIRAHCMKKDPKNAVISMMRKERNKNKSDLFPTMTLPIAKLT